MTDVLFRLDIDASPQTVLEAIKTTAGIRGFWTTRAEVPADVEDAQARVRAGTGALRPEARAV